VYLVEQKELDFYRSCPENYPPGMAFKL